MLLTGNFLEVFFSQSVPPSAQNILCAPTGDLPEPDPPTRGDRCGDRTAMMPTRQRTRAQHRADAITAERHHNQQTRQARHHNRDPAYFADTPPPTDDDEPPPF